MKSDDGVSIPASIRSKVDFPAPLGPEIATRPAKGSPAMSNAPAIAKGFRSDASDVDEIPVQFLGSGLTLGLDVILLGITAERCEELSGDDQNEQALPERQIGKSGDMHEPEMAKAKEYCEHGDGEWRRKSRLYRR